MQIQQNNNVNFGAKYISPAVVKQKIGTKWKDAQVNFIQLETAKTEDRKALGYVKYLWHEKNLTPAIEEEGLVLGGAARIYALTSQADNFEKIEPSKVLGLMTTDRLGKGKESVEIFKIGTTPRYAYEQNKHARSVRHIAKAMVDSFKELVKNNSKARVVVNFAEPHDMKFLKKVELEPQHKEFVEIIG